jgi:predicted transposase/invertase (TIGR01784 family)
MNYEWREAKQHCIAPFMIHNSKNRLIFAKPILQTKRMKEERPNPLNDYLFMKYMGEKGDEEQLLAFLNAVLQKTGKGRIASVKIEENRALTAEIIGDKSSILDLRAVMADGVRVNIEVQLRNLGNMDRRSLFYWALEYIRGIEAGQDYGELPKVIAINIVNFDFIPVDDVHACFHLWEDTRRDVMLTDALEIHSISMPQFRQLKEIDVVNNPLHRWLAFFDKNTNEETLREIIEMDKTIAKAQEKIRLALRDKEALRAYQMREMALSDYTSGINHARREGIAIGEQKGITIGEQRGIAIGEQKALAKYISRLLQKGMTAEEIAELTGLPPEEVNALLK